MTEHDPGTAGQPRLSPVTDSPWFWAYVFGTAALVALFLAGPKYIERQPQIERQYLARQRAGQAVTGREGPVPVSTPTRMIVSLRPLYALFGLLWTAAWIGLWFQRYRVRGRRSVQPDVSRPHH